MTAPGVDVVAAPLSPSRPTDTVVRRNDGVDAFRYVAFLFVVLLHCLPRGEAGTGVQMLDQICRFAVPYFFLVSGYFLASRQRSDLDQIVQVFVRIAPPFLIWLAIYCALSGIDLYEMDAEAWLRLLLTGGPAFHLWFLPALGIGVVGVIVLRGLGPAALVAVALAVFACALAFGPYRAFLGLPDPPLGMRNGPFFSFPYVAAGYLIARSGWKPGVRTAAVLALGGLLLQCAESWLLYGSLSMPFDFTAGTLLFGTGVFLLVRDLDVAAVSARLASLGRNAFAMYGVHAAFLLYLPLVRDMSVALQFSVVATLSTLFALIVGRLPILRRILG